VQLAAEASVGFPTISRGENGHPLKPFTFKKLARVLDCLMEAVLSAATPPPPPGAPLVLHTRTRTRVAYRAPARHQSELNDPAYPAQAASFPLWLLAQQHRTD
jgi:hypothetical protein